MDELEIRAARRADIPLLLEFIRELAEYEQLAHEVEATESQLAENLFGSLPQAEVLVAEWGGQPAGFALFFHNFSTFRGVRGLYLEDLFVRPDFRGRGIGKALLAALAGLAVERGCARFEWAVLDWNSDAIEFYRAMGARLMDDWRICRIDDESLQRLAQQDSKRNT